MVAGAGVYPGWWVVHRYSPPGYCQGPTHGIFQVSRSHIPVSRVPYTRIQGPICLISMPWCTGLPQLTYWVKVTVPGSMCIGSTKQCQNSAKQCHIDLKTVPNSAILTSKHCILRCTLVITRPFDWNMEVSRPQETCIPTAWYLRLRHGTVINDTLRMS